MSQNRKNKGLKWALVGGALTLAGAALSGLYMQYRQSEKTKEVRNKKKREKRAVLAEANVSNDEGEPAEWKDMNSNRREGEPAIKTNKTNKTSEKKKVKKDVVKNELSKETALEILKKIREGMKAIIQELSTSHEQQVQPGESPEDVAERFKLLYQRRTGEIREKIFKEYNTSEDECSHALQVYQNDEEVKRVCVDIERINKALQGNPLTEQELEKIPKSFTVDRLIKMMKEIQKETTQAQLKFLNNARSQGTSRSLENEFNTELMRIQKRIFQSYGVTEEIITFAMQHYANNPKLQHAMMAMQQDQHRAYSQSISASR